MEKLKQALFKELIKQGPSEENGKRIWNVAIRELLYINEEQAKSFLKLRSHPRYAETIVNKELDLMNSNKDFITEQISGGPFNLIDIASGDGTKAKFFLNLFDCADFKIRYCPVNVSEYLVNLSIENLKNSKFKCVKDFQPRVGSFNSLEEFSSDLKTGDYQRNVYLLMGSVLASFDINEYLFKLSDSMLKGDCLIIGNGIRKGERLVNIDAYKHPSFSGWFIHLMRSLGFKDDEVEYDARFNEMRVEGYYKIKVDKEIEMNGRSVKLKAGDEILVAVLYKFFEEELKKFCEMYFSEVNLFKDREDEYALVVCRK